jgi:hypothetical protein
MANICKYALSKVNTMADYGKLKAINHPRNGWVLTINCMNHLRLLGLWHTTRWDMAVQLQRRCSDGRKRKSDHQTPSAPKLPRTAENTEQKKV